MEYDKINNLLRSEESEKLSKFVTKEYVNVNSLSNTYNENKSIRFKTAMLRSDLCDYADAYILVHCTITVAGNHPRDRQNKPLILKNNAPFVSCITRINGELIEDADDLDIVMPMYNLLEYSKNYRKTIGSLYNYYRDELNNDANLANFANNNLVSSEAGNARVPNNNYEAERSGKKNVELAIPLKYLGNFWKALNITLISCEVKWNKNCVITIQRIGENLDGGITAAPTGATLAINDCKLYILVVTLSKDDEIKLLTNLKSGFTREIEWNKYRSQMSTEAINNNLNILIDPTFTNVNRLFVLT